MRRYDVTFGFIPNSIFLHINDNFRFSSARCFPRFDPLVDGFLGIRRGDVGIRLGRRHHRRRGWFIGVEGGVVVVRGGVDFAVLWRVFGEGFVARRFEGVLTRGIEPEGLWVDGVSFASLLTALCNVTLGRVM